jgi:hypothetical protein
MKFLAALGFCLWLDVLRPLPSWLERLALHPEATDLLEDEVVG